MVDPSSPLVFSGVHVYILARRNENDENNEYLHAMVVKSDKEKGNYLV
jgi:hypothetical protein